ncbi:hypothetical protein MUG84_17545 [Paenibacillus sp. KQZ6P-2]|uniref:Glycosyltransferase family 1 protein n=1 Tax=Paenibacillus mangrovi TaxID=2931978 RepID=A0A9X2B419_9BACL|nr:hypothetical protein [Paenibacillus mangrovi]MCJ8013530.1 hypothetical protein [Paenibacillus mangrovi]
MNIFMSPNPMSDQIKMLSKELSRNGNKVYHYKDPDIDRLSKFERKKMKCDIFHFHLGQTFSGHRREFTYVSKENRIRLMHHWGYEIRSKKIAERHNPYLQLLDQFHNEAEIEYLLKASRYIPACIVPNFEMVPYVSGAYQRIYILPLAVRCKHLTPPAGSDQQQVPLIVHVPNPFYDEYLYIEENLNKLSENGHRFNYVRAVNKTPDEIATVISQSDIVIDQIMCGFYSHIAVEAMNRSKAVISYIREDLRFRLDPLLPIISANPATLYDKLSRLLKDPILRRRCGEQGKTYVDQHHSLQLVARQLQWIYKNEKKYIQKQDERKYVFDCKGTKVEIYEVDSKTGYVDFHMAKSKNLPV